MTKTAQFTLAIVASERTGVRASVSVTSPRSASRTRQAI